MYKHITLTLLICIGLGCIWWICASIIKENKNDDFFLSAIKNNNIIDIKKYLDKDININVKNELGETALHITQNPKIAKLLINNGADINAKDKNGFTPIFNKEIIIATMLLDSGADINATNSKGNTLFIWYTYSGYTPGLKMLAERGADIHWRNNDGHDALYIANHFLNPQQASLKYIKSLINKKHQ